MIIKWSVVAFMGIRHQIAFRMRMETRRTFREFLVRKARRRVAMLHKVLATFGIGEERLWLRWIAASEGNQFAETVSEMTEALLELGPSPLKLRKIA